MVVSITDTPSPEGHKLRQLLPALVGSTAISLIVGASHGNTALLAGEITLVGFVAGLLSAWGRLLLALGFSLVLATVFAMAFPLPPGVSVFAHGLAFAVGGLAYIIWATALARLLAVRTRVQVLADALASFARYLRLKAAFYDPSAALDTIYERLITEHALLAEKLQAARDFCFHRIRPGARAHQAQVLYALLDAYEHALASQTDRELLRARFGETAPMRAMGRCVADHAADIETVADALLREREIPALPDRQTSCAETHAAVLALTADPLANPADARAAALLRGLAAKLFHSLQRARNVIDVARHAVTTATLPQEDALRAFTSQRKVRLAALRPHFDLASPVLRYALRLAAAMLAGFLVARSLPYAAHGHWILLTIAVVLRPSFSQTRQRHNDRILGNLIGCVIAGALLHTVSSPALLLVFLFISVAFAHAFVTVQYRVTSVAACVMGLLQLHLLSPGASFVLTERIVDTVIGALLALGFAFVLPAWERRSLPLLMKRLRETAARHAAAALDPDTPPLTYRLARKQLQDALAAVSQATARMLDEPGSRRLPLPPLHGAVTAAYLLAAQLASVRFLLQQRAADLDKGRRDALLNQARIALEDALAGRRPDDVMPEPAMVGTDLASASALDPHELLDRRLAAAADDARRLAGFTATS
nr:FUSC family membrane protein [Niveibacterium umoris]